jgi:hypothetical protein
MERYVMNNHFSHPRSLTPVLAPMRDKGSYFVSTLLMVGLMAAIAYPLAAQPLAKWDVRSRYFGHYYVQLQDVSFDLRITAEDFHDGTFTGVMVENNDQEHPFNVWGATSGDSLWFQRLNGDSPYAGPHFAGPIDQDGKLSFDASGPMERFGPGGTWSGFWWTTDGAASLVPPPALTTITVAPTPASVTQGLNQQFTALGYDQYGNAMSPQPAFTWSFSGGASMDSSGLFTAGGPFIVTASSGAVSGSAVVTVAPAALVLTSIVVSPPTAIVTQGTTQQFSGICLDQNGSPMCPQPTVNWSVSGGGSINGAGLFSATVVGGPFTVTASAGGKSGTATVTVTAPASQPPTVATPAAASPSPVNGVTSALSVLGSDDNGEASLTYTWSQTGGPAGGAAPTFSANGTNAAKNTTVTFKKAGDYTFLVTIKDAGNLTTSSSVNVTVNQTTSFITVTPSPVTLAKGAAQTFTATAKDLFGNTLTTQPTITWTATGGTVTSGGLYTAGQTAGTAFSVSATAGGKTGKANVTIN